MRLPIRIHLLLFALGYALAGCGEELSCPMGTRKLGTRCLRVVSSSPTENDAVSPDAAVPDAEAGALPPDERDGGCCIDCPHTDCDGAGFDPCAGACHSEASCELEMGQPTCRCLPGFWGDGFVCTPSECAAAPNESPCGAHTTCEDPTPDPGDVVCACETGYESCDGQQQTGCEARLATNPEHCGECGRACAGDLACKDGECQQVAGRLALGGDMSCALLEPLDANDSRAPRCWGANTENVLRTGTGRAAEPRPTEVPGLAQVRSLALGSMHACAVDDAKTLYCWGSNHSLRLGTTRADVLPGELVRVPTLREVAQLAAGVAHTCLRDVSGRVFCWGNNGVGQLGVDLSTTESATPQLVVGVNDAVQIGAGMYLTCALRASGRASCWGSVGSSTGPTEITDATGRAVPDLKQLSVGALHACGLRASGEVGCWGNNGASQLSGPAVSGYVPYTPVAGLSDVHKVATGFAHTCALSNRGEVWCWGSNQLRQVTLNTTATAIEVPTPIDSLDDAIDIEAGHAHTCARRRSGQVVCWGANASGQLGDGTTTTPAAPVNVLSLP